MKRLLLLALALPFFAACDNKPDFLKTAAEKATPIPATPSPATPPKGDWMWKNDRTLLDKKPKK